MKMKFNTKRSDRASEIYEQINMYDKKTFKYPRTITSLTSKRQQRHIQKQHRILVANEGTSLIHTIHY